MAGVSEGKVSALELFFDLVFVFAVTQIAALMRHDLTLPGLLRGLLLLGMIYWAWSMFTWTLNATGTERFGVRLALLAAMATSLLMARAIPDAFAEGGLYFVGAYFVFRIVAGLVAFSGDDPQRRRDQWKFFPVATAAGLVAVAAELVAGRVGFAESRLGTDSRDAGLRTLGPTARIEPGPTRGRSDHRRPSRSHLTSSLRRNLGPLWWTGPWSPCPSQLEHPRLGCGCTPLGAHLWPLPFSQTSSWSRELPCSTPLRTCARPSTVLR